MIIYSLLALFLLPLITADIVYARTNRLDKSEFDQWSKSCGMQPNEKKLPYKVMVHVTMKDKTVKRCVGVIINKYFVLTTATCYYDRMKNSFNDDSDMRVATEPTNTDVAFCDEDGIKCALDDKKMRVKKIIYPQLIHYSNSSEGYEKVADMALLEMVEEMSDDRQICTPPQDEMFTGEKIFLISEGITDQPFYEGKFKWGGERTCGDATTCAEKYSFIPDTPIKPNLSNGLFLVKKNNRVYLLGTLKYEENNPKIMLIFPLFYDFICSNTGDCGTVYDKYMFFRETRVIVNGLPLPQVSHCDINFADCDYPPVFFRFLPDEEFKYLAESCGKELTPQEGQKKNKWHEYPYMAAIFGDDKVCSGAFISRVHVVTVAYCLFKKDEDEDQFQDLRNRPVGNYFQDIKNRLEVRYGSECYANGNTNPQLDECKNPEDVKSIKISKVREVIVDVDKLRPGTDLWRYKYKLVILELEQPASRDVVIPICTYPGTMERTTSFSNDLRHSFHITAAGNPNALNSFVSAEGNQIQATNCEDFRILEPVNKINDFNCRDDNVDMELPRGSDSPAASFNPSSTGFLGSQLSFYNSTERKRYLYGLAPYYTEGKRDSSRITLGGFYPIWKQEQFICWFTGVCYYRGRPDNKLNRHAKIYTPNYRLTRSVLDAPVQRAGKNNLSYYDIVMLEEMDTQW